MQLSTIEKYVKVHQNLKRVNKVPTYDIQGKNKLSAFVPCAHTCYTLQEMSTELCF